jgi:hypothetical protein
MGIALFTISALFAPFQAFSTRLVLARRRSAQTVGLHPAHVGNTARQPASQVLHALPVASGPVRSPTQGTEPGRPARCAPALRVVRNIETGIPVGSTGRMVISGRMADVCAELDRLAAIESSRQTAQR